MVNPLESVGTMIMLIPWELASGSVLTKVTMKSDSAAFVIQDFDPRITHSFPFF